jgi:hypothetical protein
MEKNKELSSRTFVVEMSVNIEYQLNSIVCQLLEVKSEETRSFGDSSHALSFNAKANLLLDLNYLNKEQRQKFQIFMEVRNKFAHILFVDTFEKCFSLTNNYNQLKKLFGIEENSDDLEKDMEYMFISLSLDISNNLKEINSKILSEMVVKYTQRRFTEAVKSKKEEYILKNPSNKKAVNDFIEYIKADLLNEVDEKIKNNITPHS